MFKCELCSYSTKSKSKINKHHIIPKELNGPNNKWNLVYLCPSCHSNIYVDNSVNGCHSIKSENSIIIKGWRLSTEGRVLNYVKEGEEYFQRSKN